MPELPDVELYVEHLRRRIVGHRVEATRSASPFVLRTAVPPVAELVGKQVLGVRRLGKRIVLELEDELFVVVHLMIAGRLRWLAPRAKVPGKLGLFAFDFEDGTLLLTEAGTKRRASIHLVRGAAALATFDRGGLELGGATVEELASALARERHTLKRSLTDPTIVSGIGNAFSDEILHAARLSPLKMSDALTHDELVTLLGAAKRVLSAWTERLRAEAADALPERVTAFREGMAVHGRYGQSCPACGAKVQRIVHAENETNYCAACQTGGRLLADRSLSRLLGKDWPRSLEELEERRPAVQRPPNPARSTKPRPKA